MPVVLILVVVVVAVMLLGSGDAFAGFGGGGGGGPRTTGPDASVDRGGDGSNARESTVTPPEQPKPGGGSAWGRMPNANPATFKNTYNNVLRFAPLFTPKPATEPVSDPAPTKTPIFGGKPFGKV